jgi:hypothetical protein
MDRIRMNSPATKPSLTAHWEPKFPFDLVVGYEDAVTRERALGLYDHLAQQLLSDYDFQCSWWKFDHLQNPTLRTRAADAAVEANMVILSLRAKPEVSQVHKAWIDDWISRRGRTKAALVALVTGAGEPGLESAPMLAYLQNVARLGRMDFFTHGFETPPKSETPMDSLAKRATTVTPIMHEILHQGMPTPRWGINE